MAIDKKISELANGAPAQAGDEYVVARSGSNFKLTLTNIAATMPPIGASTPNSGAFTTLSATGVITAKNGGSAGTPDITTSGDTNTGVFFPAADTIAASTGGTERLRIDSNGAAATALLATNGIVLNKEASAASYTFPADYNGLTVGPHTINSGVVITVPSGQRWVVL